jgi:hypothetical protein
VHGASIVLTEWGGSYLNGAGTGAGVGHAVGGTANYDYHTPASWRGAQQDTHETAAFILQTMLKAHEANLTWTEHEATSYWDISDVFEEGGFAFANNSFNGNFGLVNVYGTPKPAYRAFQLLHELGDTLLPTHRSVGVGRGADSAIANDDPFNKGASGDCVDTVGVLASRVNATCLSVLLFSQATLGAPISAQCTVQVTIQAALSGSSAAAAAAAAPSPLRGAVRRIDATHTAPKAVWLEQGMPQWPSTAQKQQMFEASVMVKQPLEIQRSVVTSAGVAGQQLLRFGVEVPANGVVAVQVPLGGEVDVMAAQLRRDRRVALEDARARMVEAAAELTMLEALLADGAGV